MIIGSVDKTAETQAFSALDLLLKDGYTKEVKKQLDDAGIKLEVF
jgi:hypothetical protein